MATKDWKKVGNYHWMAKKDSNDQEIEVKNNFLLPQDNKTWNVIFRRVSNNMIFDYKHFKSKSQALAFAKKYMKTH